MAIGAAAGFVTGRMVSDTVNAGPAGKKGIKYGALVGALATSPHQSVSNAAKNLHTAIQSQGGYRMVFRRVHGRIIPIKVK